MPTSHRKNGKQQHIAVASVIFCLLPLLLLIAGCNGSKFDFAPVSGQVSLNGEPVSGARVVFMPQDTLEDGESGPYSNGTTDGEGRFTLSSIEEVPRKGAVVGNHKVIISTKQSHLDPENRDVEIIDTPESIPWEFTHYRKTPLKSQVPAEGNDSVVFDLESKKRRR